MINSTVIVGDDGVVLIDSGGSLEVGRHIAAAFPDATLISSEMCRKMVLETGGEWLAIMEKAVGRKLPETKPLAAAVTYAEGTRTGIFVQGVRLVF